ncbi:hydantoinase/oxoprolinase family protein [Sinorhizobium sp. BJ1]|uniref:hydantoinase/oxoprolinase family protein n=1 Tax=Sinorhizobium sp. BJ1 TaxID=2035455 RepID=UPI0015CF39C8|nr:hydantoinase/oxoprolinase family protein [Sinorhizobium sp. BJ1]
MSAESAGRNYAGVDVGGTFTDVVAVIDGELSIAKVPSTPNQALGIFEGVSGIAPVSKFDRILHGTTVGTNALLERKGGVAGLITTSGFEDILLLQRGDRASLYDLSWNKPDPLISRDFVVGVDERVGADGEIVKALSLENALKAVEQLIEKGVTCIGVCLLFSYLNSRHEQLIRSIIEERYTDVFVSISSEVAPEWKEYERASTTALNAYLIDPVRSYMRSLRQALSQAGHERDFLVMQSNGGVLPSEKVTALPCVTILSGPSAGVVAAAEIATKAGFKDSLTFDVGGTSTDICIIENGSPATITEAEVEGLPLKVRSHAIATIGSGGGSIARVDDNGRLHVGPQSAGSYPGPACYGRGGLQPTLTDAALVCGYLGEDKALAGQLRLNKAAAYSAVKSVADRLVLDVHQAASAIVSFAVDKMAHECRALCLERGRDVREFALVAFGGAGPMFAGLVAEKLDLKRVIIPSHPGVTAASGLLVAKLRYDVAHSYSSTLAQADPERMDAIIADLEVKARTALIGDRPNSAVTYVHTIETRYAGQTHEIEVPITRTNPVQLNEVAAAFHKLHHDRFAFAFPEKAIEFVAIRVAAVSDEGGMGLPAIRVHEPYGDDSLLKSTRELAFVGYRGAADVLERHGLSTNEKTAGPVIVSQYDTTTVVPPGFNLSVHDTGVLILEKN